MAYGWRHRGGGSAQNSPLGPPPPLVPARQGGTFAAVTLPDDQLVAALRAGDEEAFSAVVREWHSGLLRVARIFTPFFTTKGPGRGMGLGLTIAWRVMQSLGGSLEVRPGPGAEFVLRVPRRQQQLRAVS